jgi:hypothetical protein
MMRLLHFFQMKIKKYHYEVKIILIFFVEVKKTMPLSFLSFYRLQRIRDSGLIATQPDLINPMGRLTGLNTYPVIPVML